MRPTLRARETRRTRLVRWDDRFPDDQGLVRRVACRWSLRDARSQSKGVLVNLLQQSSTKHPRLDIAGGSIRIERATRVRNGMRCGSPGSKDRCKLHESCSDTRTPSTIRRGGLFAKQLKIQLLKCTIATGTTKLLPNIAQSREGKQREMSVGASRTSTSFSQCAAHCCQQCVYPSPPDSSSGQQ